MTSDQISERVKELLKDKVRSLGTYEFHVPTEMIFQDDETLWHVYVRPSGEIKERGRFYDILNDVEKKIENEDHQNIMIVPMKPENASSATPGA